MMLWKRQDGTFVAEVNGYPYHIIPGDEPLWSEAVDLAAEMGDNLEFEPVPQPRPLTVDDFRNAIQSHVDAKARERRYDSGNSLASYVNSTVAEWSAEATAFVAWRDQVWAYAYAELAKVEMGDRLIPDLVEFLNELPQMQWPD